MNHKDYSLGEADQLEYAYRLAVYKYCIFNNLYLITSTPFHQTRYNKPPPPSCLRLIRTTHPMTRVIESRNRCNRRLSATVVGVADTYYGRPFFLEKLF